MDEEREAITTGLQNLWPQVPNSLVFKHVRDDKDVSLIEFFSYVDKTLTQRGHLSVKYILLYTDYGIKFKSQVNNNLIRYAISCNVQQFWLVLSHIDEDKESDDLCEINSEPFFVNSCFTYLYVEECMFNPSCTVSWINLRSLCITYGKFDEVLIQNILSGSPLLETLVIGNTITINAPHILSLKINEDLGCKLMLLNVSSLVRAYLDYTMDVPNKEQEEEDMLARFILCLLHVKELKIGKDCLKALSRLEAKGFSVPSNMKFLDLLKMETVTQNEEDDQSEPEQSISFPIDIISVILTRLPIKPLLQFRSVSKQWLSLISSPSFAKHHHRSTSLLITTYDTSTCLRHILSVPRATLTNEHLSRAAVRVTHLMTLQDAPTTRRETTELEHLHGLVLLTTGNGFIENDFAFVINPSTREYVRLNAPGSVSVYDYGKVHVCYFFGYDEVRNEHKVLNIRMLDIKSFKPSSVEIMLFELGTSEWRKIDVEIPIDISGEDWEVFEIIKIPNEALPIKYGSWYDCKGTETLKINQPFLMKVNGFLGVLCHDRVVESNEMDIWMLKDYEERVWVKETIVFGESWVDLDCPLPSDCVNVDEIAFAPIRVSRNLIRVPIYDVKTRSFKSVKYFLGEHFLRAKTVKFNQIRSYDESILPLKRNVTTTS
nr:hypothetical protein [Tanacetum cinerariifolium]